MLRLDFKIRDAFKNILKYYLAQVRKETLLSRQIGFCFHFTFVIKNQSLFNFNKEPKPK
jgi:hypothetical protein